MSTSFPMLQQAKIAFIELVPCFQKTKYNLPGVLLDCTMQGSSSSGINTVESVWFGVNEHSHHLLALLPIQNGLLQLITGQLCPSFEEYSCDITVPVFDGILERGHSSTIGSLEDSYGVVHI